ncbi:MAG: hypothetical protein HZY79_02245 [Rhodoblastus sp.]|nr:MAG: hypothetical protein HZY79_02245 [Rhodoblastus sp.]
MRLRAAQPLGYEDATAEEIATIWRFAVAAINEATMRQARSTQMGNADSAMQNIKVTVGHTSDDTSAAPPHG